MSDDPKKNIEDILELTPMQQGMLFHTLYNEGSDAYIEQFCFDLEGQVDSDLLKKSWEEVILRHQAMRTSFRWKGIPKPVQIVHKNISFSWKFEDWSGLDEEGAEEKFSSVRIGDRKNIFDMETPPLMRFFLVKLSDSRFKLIWTFHHILMDGWSYPVIIGEVLKCYKAFLNGQSPELPDPVPYKNFIAWLAKQNKAAAEAFWRKELMGFATPSHFKGRAAITEKHESIGTHEGIKFLTEDLTSALTDFSRKNKITLSTLLQAAWAYVISEYSGEDDIIFGGTISGRPAALPHVERIVGLFINTLPARIRIDRSAKITDWLREIQVKHIEREQYSFSSLAEIQSWSELPLSAKLFENILVFENYPVDPALEDPESPFKIAHITAFEKTNLPLALLVAPGKRMKLTIAYDEYIFSHELIEGILSSLEGVLQSIISAETHTVGDISMLLPGKAQEILYGWNNTSAPLPEQESVKEFYEYLTKDLSSETALDFGNTEISYRELNERSNRLAHYLISLGLKEDDFAGICIERSPELIIALLAVLKAGAAYLPLDRSYPADRLKYMISDSGVKLILTTKQDSALLPDSGIRLVVLDEIGKEISVQYSENTSLHPSGKSVAYMIYTSGSTGKPKGVIMENLALVNLLNWQINGQKFERGSTTLQFTTLSFDVAFQEIFSTLLTGGKLVILSENQRKDFSSILEMLKTKKVKRLFLPFIALQELAELQSTSTSGKLHLNEVMTAGEQLQNTPAIKKFFSELDQFKFTNQYGPTEAHVVTAYSLEGNPGLWEYNAPIGKPVFNTRIRILDKAMKPVPPGVTGTLFIGGMQVARGYHNLPDLTAEKFIKDPYSNDEWNRLYNTGDLARYMSDGNIEFLGRADGQIKYRGYRIELGEIESMLNSIEKVSTSAVILRTSASGDSRMAAYIVPKQDGQLTLQEIKSALANSLPEYMMPADFVFLKQMPLTPSGKIDVRSLPEPEMNLHQKDASYAVPRNELELQLVRIWEKVLGLKNIGIKDNFFELGGHSLLAIRVFGYIEKLSGKKLAISTLFSHPTIEELAGILVTEGWKPTWKSLVAVKPGGSKLPFFCVPPGAGTALHFQSLVKYLPDDQPFYVLESIGFDGKEPPHDNIEDMAMHYVKEIRTLQPDGPYLLGGRCLGGRVVFEMAQQLLSQGQEVALLAIFDTWPPFRSAPEPYIHPKRNLKHIVTRSVYHMKSGDFFKTTRNLIVHETNKAIWLTRNRIKYITSSKKQKLYKKILLLHFSAQDKYIARKYPGKITLIECSAFKPEFREGWKELAGGGLDVFTVPDTDHKTIVVEPKLGEFAEKLNFVLQRTHNELSAKFAGSLKDVNLKKSVAASLQGEE